MKEASLTDLTTEVAVGARRAEVMAKLRTAETPLSVAEVAARTGLHINTARFHLDGLVDDALADRIVEERGTPGRPRILYTVRAGAGGPRSYGLLSEMLIGLIATLDGDSETALDAGRSWGRRLVEEPAQTNVSRTPSQITLGAGVSVDDALIRLNKVLEAIGFQPEVAALTDGNLELHLHHCPFREVAERHTDVVCALHLGLMQGALLDAPLAVESLNAFVTSDLCSAPLRVISSEIA